MNISAIAIKRPVFTVMVILALMVFGFLGLSRLGTDLFPDIAFPVVAVTIVYPGASPSEVETLVSKPIEDSVVSLNGIDRIKTFSREGVSSTIIMFKLGVDIEEAATQVRERVAQTRFKLPQEVKEPAINRFDVGAARSPARGAPSRRRRSSPRTSSSLRSSRSTAWPPSRCEAAPSARCTWSSTSRRWTRCTSRRRPS